MSDLTKIEIAFIGVNRERTLAGDKPSATYTFSISSGPSKGHAEVVFADGGREVIASCGQDAKRAARIALE